MVLSSDFVFENLCYKLGVITPDSLHVYHTERERIVEFFKLIAQLRGLLKDHKDVKYIDIILKL